MEQFAFHAAQLNTINEDSNNKGDWDTLIWINPNPRYVELGWKNIVA